MSAVSLDVYNMELIIDEDIRQTCEDTICKLVLKMQGMDQQDEQEEVRALVRMK